MTMTKHIDAVIAEHRSLANALDNAARDKDHATRIARGVTPWPNTREQILIDFFDIFQTEREAEQW